MKQTLTSHLLVLGERFSALSGMALTTIGERAAGDWRFYEAISVGRLNFRIGTYDRATKWFSDNWPEGADWPHGVPRPLSATEEAA